MNARDGQSNLPISEQYRLAGIDWANLDGAARLFEESKSSVLSQITAKILTEDLKLPVNKAEIVARTSSEWKEFITKMVEARKNANLAKINLEYTKMLHMEQMSHEATSRVEAKL